MSITISPDLARRLMVAHHGLARTELPAGAAGVRALLQRLRCIQLDPLDPIGTNADLVALARVEGIRKGDVYHHLLPGHAFEHFAKERCLLPASAFPWYRQQAAETPWWRLSERLQRLPEGVIEAVLAEITTTGPCTAAELMDHGAVEAMDWSGWKGTTKAATMALEVLWTRCQIVVTGRVGRGKRYDLPARALPQVAHHQPGGDFGSWALVERAEAAGLLSRASGPHWSMLSQVRTGPIPDALIEAGALVEIGLPDSRRRWLAPADLLDRSIADPDDRMRILGPLDPLIWDRKLVELIFGFTYIWEVYKPADQRRWGWYVCPLLHRGHLVGRFEAHVAEGRLVVDRLWKEPGHDFDEGAFHQALARHEAAIT